MNSLLILFAYNRPKMLIHSIKSIFYNTNYSFDEVLIINDGSNEETSKIVASFILDNLNHPKTKFSLMHFGKNQGYGWASEYAFNYAKWRNPKYLFFIESDYVFRKNWAEESIAVLEACPKTLALSGFSHPDFYLSNKINKDYPEAIIREYGFDPCPREYLFKPFLIKTSEGEILVQGTSNSSGCAIVNWHNFMKLNSEFPTFWKDVLMRASNNFEGGNRKTYGDGPFSHGSCFYWYQSKSFGEITKETEFAWLDICDFSIGNHICGGEDSINGYIVPELHTFVSSPKWNPDFVRSKI